MSDTYRDSVDAFDAAGFGHRVQSARVWARIAPKELASRLGRSAEAIYRIERGEHSSQPDTLLLRALAEELGQTEQWLVSGTDPPWRTETAGEIPSEIMRRLADARAALEEVEEAARRVPQGPPRRRAENE